MLEPHGYTMLKARSGREALQTCKQYEGPIHLLLTDVVMPEMSGVQLAQDLGRTRSLLKVLFMSGYATHAAANHSILEPGADYIQKPFTPGKLARKVRQVLDGVQSALLASGS
jgi:DNA-binding NtrC family response regulator